jgi:hypothetical protein
VVRARFRVGPILALLLAACADGPALEGTVVDVWGHPVGDANIVVEGIVARHETDRTGHFHITLPSEATRVIAGKQGYIKQALDLPPLSAEGHLAPVTFSLFPAPPVPGLYAVGTDGYLRILNGAVRTAESLVGIDDVPGDPMAAPSRFLLRSTLRPAEIDQLDLQLSRMKRVDRVKSGRASTTVGLWVRDAPVPFELTALPTRDDYVLAPVMPLTPGVYAFHANGVLDLKMPDLARDLQLVFPFEVG